MKNLDLTCTRRYPSLAVTFLATALVTAQAAAGPTDRQVFATVDTQIITLGEFSQALSEGVRRKYYHGKIPETEQAEFQQQVARDLIDRTLLLREADRLALVPDSAWVRTRLDTLDQRGQKYPQWATHRERMLEMARKRLERDSQLKTLEANIREVPPPTEAQLRRFFEENRERFTEPERFRISAILLRVAPSSASKAWTAAREEARVLVKKLRSGADFAELARLHSGDSSADNGGDMGYLHRGMLGTPAQEAIDDLAVGAITDPVTLLEGVAIFRLEERPTPKRQSYQEVRERVATLWTREKSQQAWEEYLRTLRKGASIQVNNQHLLRPISNAPPSQ